MIELRKDYILDRWVVLAQSRKKRPKEYAKQATVIDSKACVFCSGNEKHTPPEIGRIGSKSEWKMRWFKNLFPAVEEDGQREPRTDNTFYTFAAAYGSHEIVVETPKHERQLWDFSADELSALLAVYADRINELQKKGARYVSVFKNHGSEGGASIVHSHSQVISTGFLPPVILEEASAFKNLQGCPYCSIIASEKNSFRRCFENSHAVAFTPYASRFNFELWVFPKRHFKALSEATTEELHGIAEVLSAALKRLKALNAPYNYFLHYLPSEGDFHFHIEVQPRLSTWAGFELSTGVIINSVLPEEAAKFYRGEE